ncbi:hypothetical protein [Peribacillus frigoritolerans]|uniref:hypothetical protein n=1 Tax=Peribacillus frigoritolerans TaxID=450367 RepID=UPI002415C996|nr:hypothetical protein [Peribacillus frigoritolerans]MDG4850349.1 hypothetical protein [Peribacillus frigoritolerans]
MRLLLSMSLEHPEMAKTIKESELTAFENIRGNYQEIINEVELEYNQATGEGPVAYLPGSTL